LKVSAKQCQRIAISIGSKDPTPEVPEWLKDSLWVVPKLNEIHRQHTPAGSAEEAQEASQGSRTETSQQIVDEKKDDSVEAKKRFRQPRFPKRFAGRLPI
jgi:hypothetical protein